MEKKLLTLLERVPRLTIMQKLVRVWIAENSVDIMMNILKLSYYFGNPMPPRTSFAG